MKLQTLKSQFAVEFIDLPEAAAYPSAKWEPFQIAFLNNNKLLGIDVKSRQIAWSFTAALDAFVDSRINPGNPYIFVSINLDEAKEKIRYLRYIVAATDLPVRPKSFKKDTEFEIEFEDGSRFISHPCRPVRGKPQARVYLDEIAHYPTDMDRTIYTAALPATTKGGYLRIGSSPLGARGLLWEIMEQTLRQWPGFVRNTIPWWEVRALTTDYKQAKKEAPQLSTKERVDKFGNSTLQDIYTNMFLEDFQQEYECAYADESTAWISWEDIARNQDKFVAGNMRWWHATTYEQVVDVCSSIRYAIATGQIESSFSAGIDVGRVHDLTECVLCGKASDTSLPVRFAVSLDQVKFTKQLEIFKHILDTLPISQMLIDQNGIGMQLAEELADYAPGKAQGTSFTNPSKELWAVEVRLKMESAGIPLPPDRDLQYQIHSIKKIVTEAKNNRFDTVGNEKHHADKFWALALAVWAGRSAEAMGAGFSV